MCEMNMTTREGDLNAITRLVLEGYIFMNKIIAPSHIEKYCKIVQNDKFYIELRDRFASDYSYVYKIICNCNNEKFVIYKSNQPSIYAICNKCKNKIVVYDLLQYPAAVVLNKTYDFVRITDLESELYMNYEYSDEYLYENDVDFDNNDISWARAFITDKTNLKIILDDETT